MSTGPQQHQDTDPILVISRRTLRRATVSVLAVLVLAGVGLGAFFLGRSSAPNHPSTLGSPKNVTFIIESTSMYPTLKFGGRVVVNKLDTTPSPGEIVVFRSPPREDCGGPFVPDLVKRVIGMPGQTIQGKDGAVYINGQRMAEPWLPHKTANSSPYTTTFGPIKIPKADYFMMGDNRTDSCDSRDYGPVSGSYIIGKVVKVIPGSSTTITRYGQDSLGAADG